MSVVRSKMEIKYNLNPKITMDEFINILKNSTLGERRPIDDIMCIEGMLEHADILVTAMHNDIIVGVARAVTDFNYCCYLSDLAVHVEYQKKGIGKELISQVQAQLSEKCKVILLSSPQAREYYPKVGFTKHDSAWVVANKENSNQKTSYALSEV
jgi:N-acetylglutamate synthase-like GNAT family acetyltransferase